MVTRLVALALVVLTVAAVVQRLAPADLLAVQQRPYAGYGTPDVRTESLPYPRYATGADPAFVFTRQAAGSSAAQAGVPTR